MSWGAQNRSKDAKTPSGSRGRSEKPELDRCPVQQYVVKCHVKHDEVALAHIVEVVAEEVANLRALLPLQIEVVDNEHIGFAFLARALL
jgi:hypothetical protein